MALFCLLIGLGLLFCWWQLYRRTGEVSDLGFKVRVARIGDLEVHYVDEGKGQVVLLLHGIGANLLVWRRLWPLLTSKYRIIALDLPGFGRSSKNCDSYGLDEQVERIEIFLNHIGVRGAHLVGNSMGGNIALWFAVKRPERTTSVTCIAPATSPELIPFSVKFLNSLSGPISMILSRPAIGWAHRRTVTRKELVDQLRIDETWNTYGRSSEAVRCFFLATETLRDSRLSPALPKIQDEVLVLWGKKDRLVPERVIEQLKTSLEKPTVKVHFTGGHHLQEDEPEWVAEQLITFFGHGKIANSPRPD